MTRHAGCDRRTVTIGLSAALAAFLGGLPTGVLAQEARSARFSRVAADVRPLAARGGGALAALIQQLLPQKLGAAFGDRLVPGDRSAPILVARIDTLYLSAFADSPSVGINSLGTMDSMEGAGLVVAGRQTLSITPLRVTLPAGYSGAYYLPDIDRRRIDSLCESFASWLQRDIGS